MMHKERKKENTILLFLGPVWIHGVFYKKLVFKKKLHRGV
jgi:hypothetical protein